MPEIQPDRSNWRQFCQEPPLNEEELADHDQLMQALKVARLIGGTTLDDFIMQEAAEELRAFAALQEAPRTEDWSDVVAFSDANRRLMRAEIRAFREWKERIV